MSQSTTIAVELKADELDVVVGGAVNNSFNHSLNNDPNSKITVTAKKPGSVNNSFNGSLNGDAGAQISITV